MNPLQLVQGSAEWHAFKVGKLGASRVHEIMTKLKDGSPGASRATYRDQLVAERLTGIATETYKSPAMRRGNELEPRARAAYQFERLVLVELVGCVVHPTIPNALASCDGLVNRDGLVEFKCPLTKTHIDTLLGGAIPNEYQQQMQWQMACSRRRWCDYVSFDPDMPPRMRLHIQRVERNDGQIAVLENEVRYFLAEIEDRLDRLLQRYPMEKAAA